MKANNYIFRNLIFIPFFMLSVITANSQGTRQTPMGQTIAVINNWDTSGWIAIWEAAGAQEVINNGWDAVRIGPATSNYNCHSYAWNVTEAGSSANSWINQNTDDGNPNLSKYWTNDAYTSTSYVADHEKIFYGTTPDHSAITTATAGKVKSKWGPWPLYEHSTAQCPFNAGSLTYYTLKSLSISNASGVLCNNIQRTLNNGFTASNWSYDWNAIGYLNQVSGDGTPNYTVSGTSSLGYGTLFLNVTSPSGLTASTQKNIGVNVPLASDMYLDLYTSGGTKVSFLCPNTTYHIYLMDNDGSCSLSNYSWSIPSAWNLYYQYQNMISINTNSSPGARIEVNANTCCVNNATVFTGYISGGYCGSSFTLNVFPNPTTGGETTLAIEPASEAVVFDENAEWEVEIFDQMQVLKKQKTKLKGKEFKIQTTGWKIGIYIIGVKYKDEYLQTKFIVN